MCVSDMTKLSVRLICPTLLLLPRGLGVLVLSVLQVSVALNRTMTQVVADTAREQARATVNATVNAVTPAVASAVAASLQQELASAAGEGAQLATIDSCC